MIKILKCFLFATLSAAIPLKAQHGHIYAGAASQVGGEPLFFVNGNLWDTNSYGGYAGAPACVFMEANLPDAYPNLYQTTTTFSALPATIFNAGPSPNAAALGSFIEMRFVSLQGPAGATFTVWSEIEDPTQPTALFIVPVGTIAGTNRIALSEGDATDSQSDPYGHIHGRRFTVDKPGLYTLGLQLVDSSANGPDAGPIHTPSQVTSFYFQAGLFLSDLSFTSNVATARFGLEGSKSYTVEASATLSPANWVTVTNVVAATHSELRWFNDPDATTPTRFYRIREEQTE